jgi:hypothetical protein
MKSSLFCSTLIAAFVVSAAPLDRRTSYPVSSTLAAICDKIGGTQVTSTVCKTVTGLDVSVTAVDPATGETALVTLSGGGLLKAASITVPVASLNSIIDQLTKRSINPVIAAEKKHKRHGNTGTEIQVSDIPLAGDLVANIVNSLPVDVSVSLRLSGGCPPYEF